MTPTSLSSTARPPRAGRCRCAAPVAVLGAVVLLAPAACGGGSSSGAASSATSSASASPTQPSGRPATVVLTRTGGIAGFSDRLDVAPDGTVTGTTRAGEVTCRIDTALAATLLSDPAPATPSAVGTDRVTVTLDRLGTIAALGEAQGADALSAAARSLLDDVQLAPEQRSVCR